MRLAVQETSTDSDAQKQLRTPHEVEELLGDSGELTLEVKSKLLKNLLTSYFIPILNLFCLFLYNLSLNAFIYSCCELRIQTVTQETTKMFH